jgi:hypothetical protein
MTTALALCSLTFFLCLVGLRNASRRSCSAHRSESLLVSGSGLAPAKDVESTISATLVPGAYTAIVRGKDGSTGVALVEVYDLQ